MSQGIIATTHEDADLDRSSIVSLDIDNDNDDEGAPAPAPAVATSTPLPISSPRMIPPELVVTKSLQSKIALQVDKEEARATAKVSAAAAPAAKVLPQPQADKEARAAIKLARAIQADKEARSAIKAAKMAKAAKASKASKAAVRSMRAANLALTSAKTAKRAAKRAAKRDTALSSEEEDEEDEDEDDVGDDVVAPNNPSPSVARTRDPDSDSSGDDEISKNHEADLTDDENEQGSVYKRRRKVRRALFVNGEYKIGTAMSHVKKILGWLYFILVCIFANACWMTWTRVLRSSSSGVEGMTLVNWVTALLGVGLVWLGYGRTVTVLKAYRRVHREQTHELQSATANLSHTLQRMVLFDVPFQKFFLYLRYIILYLTFVQSVSLCTVFLGIIGLYDKGSGNEAYTSFSGLDPEAQGNYSMLVIFSTLIVLFCWYILYLVLHFDHLSVITFLHDAKAEQKRVQDTVQVVVVPMHKHNQEGEEEGNASSPQSEDDNA